MSVLAEALAAALLGPRRVGKTTLAFELANTRPAVCLDLESSGNENNAPALGHYDARASLPVDVPGVSVLLRDAL